MTMPTEKIEVGFDTSFSAAGNFFVLDDATKGQLDNASYPLGGLQFVDVTSRVRNFSINRGRTSIFSQFPAGQASIEFNNHDRAFDPLYTGSPYYGNIIPRREIRITSGTAITFSGWIDDWNLTYTPNGDSIVEAVCYDALGVLAGQTLSLGTPTEELSGSRVSYVLDQINWSSELRNIDTGIATLSTAEIAENTNALTYLQSIASSEPGLVFIGREGKLQFRDRVDAPTSTSLIELGGTAIPFSGLQVVYGSENLYNQVSISRVDGGTATAQDAQSIEDYGLRELNETGLLLSTDAQLVDLALVLAQRYSQPEYHFEAVEIATHNLDPADQVTVLQAEIGSICKVTFTPNGIGDAIERYVRVIRIQHSVTPETHFVEFGFQALDFAPLVLDDAEFGKLNSYSLSW